MKAIITSLKFIAQTGQILLKADPYAFYSELRPGTASRVVDLEGYEWQDQAWQQQKKESTRL